MSKDGRLIASAAAVGITASAAGLCYLAANQGHSPLYVQFCLAAFAAVVLPAGWLLGRYYNRLLNAATMDCLTGAYNRQFIETTFKKLLRQAARKRKKMSVIMLDVNDFKEVNDRFGHQQGDAALALLVETLRSCSERAEIVGRWGGDEFIMICPYGDDKALDRMTKRIHEQLSSVSRRIGIRLSVSTGYAVFPEQGNDLSQLTLAADKRMYAEKFICKMQETEPAALQA